MFLSMSFRLKVEVEALNMVEAMGAYSRHRTVSLLKPRGEGKGYRLVIAPAVSGQAIAYGYMKSLVELATIKNLPLCGQCRNYENRGGFIKHGTDSTGKQEDLIRECVVDDITGFMIAQANVRRTSPIQFSYMVPDIEGSDVSIEPQFHVRAPMPGQKPQPFQVEAGTAIYVLGVALDIDKIGAVAGEGGVPKKVVDSRVPRIRIAIQALANLIEGLSFGAKKARYLPIYDVVGAIAALSHPVPFMVSPARVGRDGSNYISKTLSRASNYVDLFKDVNEEIEIVYMDKEGLNIETKITNVKIENANNVSELVAKILKKVEEKVRD
ncbi:MAG: DevR family CRISPR-associated autoregulator [Ignisphaera sp.]